MGNSLNNGFQNLPGVYLRDLRRKTRLRFRSILTAQRSGQRIAKKKDSDEEAVTELNSKSVAEYVISNPDFLDDLVKKHISQDRVRAWIKEPIYDDIGIIEAVDHEGNVEISSQEEAEEEEEEVYKSSSSRTRKKEKGRESESSSREVGAKVSDDPISKKFSKKILQTLSAKSEDVESEAESEKKKSEDERTRDSEDKRDSDASSIEEKPSEEKHEKKSRGDSSFQQQSSFPIHRNPVRGHQQSFYLDVQGSVRKIWVSRFILSDIFVLDLKSCVSYLDFCLSHHLTIETAAF
ncbi:hypothetical protein AVEN_51781-1 [Araneus ventricosus]|uniref:Uncharacterized protein n=1 Tax=Araneus ventricosus TaxID=182803 RepID=A0A4Y2MU02_ARAVE|nr:hypothetical protein AVEN_51781-1 [Araneus ventricosus]